MVKSIADVRLDNTLLLYTDFVRARLGSAVDPRHATLEAPFAEQLKISPSYWSQLKGRHRQIGETLARQFEHHCGKPLGWLDETHPAPDQAAADGPRNADERFLVQMLLTCYRANPAGVKVRLLELLDGELAKGTGRGKRATGLKVATGGR
jgi:hypothetical protein